MNDAPVISEGMNQRIGALVVAMTTAKTIPERLFAIDMLAADADSHVNTYLREIGGDSPTIENIRLDIQNKLSIALSEKPEEGSEDMEYWADYVKTLEHQRDHIVEAWGDRVGYQMFVEKWDSMYREWGNLVDAMSLLIEGGMAQVFDTRRKSQRAVTLPMDPNVRLLIMRPAGVPDFGQGILNSHADIRRAIGDLDRRIFMAAGKFSAVFAEIFGDLTVYRDNFLQYLALHRADEKGKLDEALHDMAMRKGDVF